ncbi:MAG: GtrA family protein [Patescibacteria group bacterium]
MVKKTMKQLTRHCAAGVVPFAANIVTFTVLFALNAAPDYQTVIAFIVGGQVAFWTHDRWTYRVRNPSLDGWKRRWCWFMPGQIGGALLNLYVAIQLNDAYDYWLWSIVVYVLSTAAGVTITFSWTNWLSHKDDSSTDPAEHAKEHAQT